MSVCPGCGEVFRCGVEEGGSACWCFGVEASSLPERLSERCYCEKCLTGGDKPSIEDLYRRIAKHT